MNSDSMEEYRQKRARTRELIESVTFCQCGYYCTLKEYLCTVPRSSREIRQIKCVEKFKFERGGKLHRPVDWQEGFALWMLEGHAAAFDRHFTEEIGFNDLYRLVMYAPREGAEPAGPVAPRWVTGLDAQLANGFPLNQKKPGEEDHHRWWKDRRKLLEDIAGCTRGHYCTLKEILCSGPRTGREILQIKCVEKFKYDRSNWQRRHIDWDEAFKTWIEEGNARRFSELYHDGIHFETIYRRIMGLEPSHTHS